jgi:hypothetical protein
MDRIMRRIDRGAGVPTADACRKDCISDQTFYRCTTGYGQELCARARPV